jgi:lambda family phage portal protein
VSARDRLPDLAPNLLDRAIGYVAPRLALERLRARAFTAVMGNYYGGSTSRRAMLNFNPRAQDADADLNPDLPTLRARSRDLERNSPLARGAINTVTTRVVGTGLALQSALDAQYLGLTDEQAAEKKAEIEREFRAYCESAECDVTRTQDFYELQDLALRSTLASGDVFVNLPYVKRPGELYGLKVQMIEGDRVCNPDNGRDSVSLSAGIVRDSYGAPLSCHVMTRHPGSNVSGGTRKWTEHRFFTPKGARAMLHLFDRRRPGQTRGEPFLAPVIEPLKQLDRYTEAEITAAVISGMFTVFWKTNGGENSGLPNDPAAGSSASTGTNGDAIQMGAGAIVDIGQDDEVEFANPTRPNPAFDPFVQAILRQVGVALELPFEVLVKHFTSSYSAARAALLDAWQFFRKRRAWLAKRFCQPVFEVWMDEAVANGRIAAPGYFADPMVRRAYLMAEWVGDGPGSIDPLKEVQAAEKRLSLNISTLEKETMLHDGGDWRANMRQRSLEAKARKAYDLEPPAPPVAPGGAQPGAAPGAEPRRPDDDEIPDDEK